MFPRHSATNLPRGTNSRSVLQGYPSQDTLRFDQLRTKFRGSSGTTLRPASQISSRPPHFPPVVAGAPQARPTVSVSPRLPPIPQSSGVHPLTRAKCYVTPSPLNRVHRIIPCTPQSPIRATSSHFAAVPLWGPGPVDRTDVAACLVDLPPPEDGRRYGCTLLYGGDTRGDATSHEVAPEDGSLISTGSSGSARHTATAKVVMNTSFHGAN
jgi:hypothetical protein